MAIKIGILTYHRAKNYGAYLQAYALCARLQEEQEFIVEIIDFHMDKEIHTYKIEKKSLLFWLEHIPMYLFKRRLFHTFEKSLEELSLSSEYMHSDKIEEFRNFVYDKYDVIIAGSDEIWKMDSYRGFPTPYWLAGDLGCEKYSYAVSSRIDYSRMSQDDQRKVKEYILDLDIVSVRDKITFHEIEKLIGWKKQMYLSPDPTFIYDFGIDKDESRSFLLKKTGLDGNKKVMLVMLGGEELNRLIRRECSDEFEMVSVYHWNQGMINVSDVTPLEWLKLIAGSDYVLTTYFHGVCASILNNIPFYALDMGRSQEKILDVLEESNLSDRMILEGELFGVGNLNAKIKNDQWKPDNSAYLEKCRNQFEVYLNAMKTNDKRR